MMEGISGLCMRRGGMEVDDGSLSMRGNWKRRNIL